MLESPATNSLAKTLKNLVSFVTTATSVSPETSIKQSDSATSKDGSPMESPAMLSEPPEPPVGHHMRTRGAAGIIKINPRIHFM